MSPCQYDRQYHCYAVVETCISLLCFCFQNKEEILSFSQYSYSEQSFYLVLPLGIFSMLAVLIAEFLLCGFCPSVI